MRFFDTEIKELVDKFTSLDMNAVIREFEQTYDIDLPREYKEVICKSYSLQLEKYNSANEKLEKRIAKTEEALQK